ncbi:Rnf111 [Symbiodinium sp. CCMP2592]|nr:Rnf111 [Symbiodinium sp. CCMP2592]CAE7523017.1 Rnf111 [Symbiodinium sp. CCMP2592]
MDPALRGDAIRALRLGLTFAEQSLQYLVPAPSAQSRPPIPRRPHNGMLDSRVTRSRSPQANRAEVVLNRGRMRQRPTHRRRSPSPLRRASPKRRGARGRPQPPTRHPARIVSHSARPPTAHSHGGPGTLAGSQARVPSHPRRSQTEQTRSGNPTSGPNPPIGLCIRGARGATSATGGQAVHAAMALLSPTFACLQPVFHVTQVGEGSSSYVLVGHHAFQDIATLVSILRELQAGNGGRMATAIGDIHVEAADTDIGHEAARRLAVVSESGDTPEDPNMVEPHACLRPAADGNTEPAQRTSDPTTSNMAEQHADMPDSSDTVRAPVAAEAPIVPAAAFNAESGSGPTPPPEAVPPPSHSPEHVGFPPSSLPLSREEPVPHPVLPSSGHAPHPAPADAVDGAPPRHSLPSSASPASPGSAGIAPMTPPVDCELTPQLRGVEYVLGPNCLLPVTSCTSCLQPFEAGETLVRLVCMHYFHKECVTRWFSSPIHGHRCPSCNVNLIGLDG